MFEGVFDKDIFERVWGWSFWKVHHESEKVKCDRKIKKWAVDEEVPVPWSWIRKRSQKSKSWSWRKIALEIKKSHFSLRSCVDHKKSPSQKIDLIKKCQRLRENINHDLSKNHYWYLKKWDRDPDLWKWPRSWKPQSRNFPHSNPSHFTKDQEFDSYVHFLKNPSKPSYHTRHHLSWQPRSRIIDFDPSKQLHPFLQTTKKRA